MKEARYFYVPEAARQMELPTEEAVHAIRVLRLKEGDELFLMDGEGTFFRAVVTMTNSKRCYYEIVETLPQERPWKGYVHLAIAPTKNIDRMEWMAEKATEIGFDELTFLDCQFSERRQLREDRIEKIVVAAMKQSRKAWKPKVNAMTSFREFIGKPREGQKFIAHCYDEVPRKELFPLLTSGESSQTDEPCTILVGPEGDFSIDEVRQAVGNGYESVSLGKSRLRTETAGLAAVMMARLGFIWIIALAALLTGCSKSDYQTALPANCTALMSVDVSKTSGVGSQALLQALLYATGTDDCGIDLTQKVYLFETADGNLGLCTAVRDANHLGETLADLAQKGHGKPVEEVDGMHATVLNGSWVMTYSDAALLLTGPVVAADQRAMQGRLARYLSQEEERSAVATPMFQKLDSIDAPMALVAQVQALPEQFVAPFLLGAPQDADASQVLLAASMKNEEGCLLMEGETFSFNKKINRSLKDAAKVYRPLKGRFAETFPADALMGVFMNVEGQQFLPLMQANEGLQALLAGINVAIDMNNIIKSVDGDMAVIASGSQGTEASGVQGLSLVAELAHANWLKDVDYWKKSCPSGGRISDWGKDSYYYTDGKTSFYFGVASTPAVSSMTFFSGDSREQAQASIKAATNPVAPKVQQYINNGRLVMVLNIESINVDDGLLSNLLPLFKPLLGQVNTVVYTMQ